MLRGVMTAGEASKLWGKKTTKTLRDGLNKKYGKYGELVEGIDYAKSNMDWLITEEAMEKLYGKRDDNNGENNRYGDRNI